LPGAQQDDGYRGHLGDGDHTTERFVCVSLWEGEEAIEAMLRAIQGSTTDVQDSAPVTKDLQRGKW
jgi:hypothetical protein